MRRPVGPGSAAIGLLDHCLFDHSIYDLQRNVWPEYSHDAVRNAVEYHARAGRLRRIMTANRGTTFGASNA